MMFESTKTLPVMQRLPVRDLRAAQMVRSVQLRDSPGLGAVVLGFPFHQLPSHAPPLGALAGKHEDQFSVVTGDAAAGMVGTLQSLPARDSFPIASMACAMDQAPVWRR